METFQINGMYHIRWFDMKIPEFINLCAQDEKFNLKPVTS
jgi:hypothetical protein